MHVVVVVVGLAGSRLSLLLETTRDDHLFGVFYMALLLQRLCVMEFFNLSQKYC